MEDKRADQLWQMVAKAASKQSLALDAAAAAWLRQRIAAALEALGGRYDWLGDAPEDRLERALREFLDRVGEAALGGGGKVEKPLLLHVLDLLVERWGPEFPLAVTKATPPQTRGPSDREEVSREERRSREEIWRELRGEGDPKRSPGAPTRGLPGPEEEPPERSRGEGTRSTRPPNGDPSRRRRAKPPSRGLDREPPDRMDEETGGEAPTRGIPRMAAPEPESPPPPPPEPDPPRTAFARLDAPEAVVSGAGFEVAAGLAEKQSPGVVGGPMERPPSSSGPYTLTVQLVAQGFLLQEGETWRRELPVTAAAPYPAEVFHLTPEPQDEPLRARTIQAFYSVDGQTIGMALRPVAVAKSAAAAAAAPSRPAEPGVDMSVPAKATAPDLEVRISLDPERPGGLLWTFMSPHAMDLPDEPQKTDIGDHPREFARQLVDKVNAKEGQPGLFPFLSGIGLTIADQMPPAFWDLLRAAAAARAGGAPDLLILSQEPYVPWELAKVDPPLLDPAAPPFLAAQANVGRWVLGQRRPKQPPPTAVPVRAAAVVSGVYNRPGWRRLQEAEDEAAKLAADPKLRATPVNAATLEVFDCLGGMPPADLLHFAVHGIYDPASVQEGLVMVDGQVLDPLEVKGTALAGAPFVFLNACQVGSGNRVLGDYAGMAAAFLEAGAAGVVAPLWSVKDAVAKEIALAFYTATAAGACPAAALREARKGFKAAVGPQSATYLAYQFFGHPALKLEFAIPE